MIDDLLLRWVVTALFAISAAECAFAMVLCRRSWPPVVSNALHFAMAVAMAVMAWPAGAALPTTAPMAFFLLAAGWFAARTLIATGHRVADAYHTTMMVAMAWMYAVMGGTLLPRPADGGGAGMGHGGHHGGHSMAGADTTAASAPVFIDAVNWLWTVGFAVAAVWWLYVYFTRRRAESALPASRFFGTACQSMMAAGMSIMFAVML